LIAPDEWSKGQVRIKNLRVGQGKGQEEGGVDEQEKEYNVDFSEL